MKEFLLKLLVSAALILIIVLPLVLAIFWILWSLYLWIIPQLWPDAPSNILHPSYWLFIAVWTFVGWFCRSAFGGHK